MKIFVAIPVYDGKLPVEVVRAILQEQLLGAALGDEISYCFLPNCSHAAQGRNQLAQQFMDSDFERLFFLDADVTFQPGDIIKTARRLEDVVGGAYRYKMDKEDYPVGWLQSKELWSNTAGLLEVETLPGGFLAISRKAFETLKDKFPDRHFTHFGRKMHCYFQMKFLDGLLYGEDSLFCREWREAGGTVWLDPELTLTHWDHNRPFIGHIGNWLKQRPQIKETA